MARSKHYTAGRHSANQILTNLFLHLSFTIILFAQLSGTAFGQTEWLSLQTGSTGSPGAPIQCLMLDNNCNLWMGGGGSQQTSGFARYDGSTFFNPTSLYGSLPVNLGVNDIAIDSTGHLWICTIPGYNAEGSTSRFDGKNWRHFTELERPLKIVCDQHGTLYGASSYGLLRFDADLEKWLTVPISGFDNRGIIDICMDYNNQMWLLTEVDLFYKVGSDFLRIKPPDDFKYAHKLYIDFNNSKWILGRSVDASYHFTSKVLIYKDQKWITLTPNNSILPNVHYYDLAVDAEETVWLTSYDGTFLLSTNPADIERVKLLDSYKITSIIIDADNQKWLGTSNGEILMYDGQVHTVAGRELGLPSNQIVKIKKDKDSRLWIASTSGLAVADGFDISKWPLPGEDSVYQTVVSTLAIDSANAVWAGYATIARQYYPLTPLGVIKIENAQNRLYTPGNSSLPDGQINDIYVDSSNRKWIATNNGVAKIDNDVWTIYTENNGGLIGNNIKAITVDNAGLVWIASDSGLNTFDGETWFCYTKKNSPLTTTDFTALAADEQNHLWIGTMNGLFVLADGEWTVYTMNNSILPSPEISGFNFSTPGIKWIITNSYWHWGQDTGGGLIRIENDKWSVVSNKPTMNAWDADYDDDGNLWIATSPYSYDIQLEAVGGGLLIYNPNGVTVPEFKETKGAICLLTESTIWPPDDPSEPPDSTDTEPELPSSFDFSVAPNPGLGYTTITVSLVEASHLRVNIYDLLGQKVITLLDEEKQAGDHHIVWLGLNYSGEPVAGGVYVCRIITANGSYHQKLTLFR